MSVHSNRGHNEQNADSLVHCRGVKQALTPHCTCVPESLPFVHFSIPQLSHSTRVTIGSVAESQNIPLPCLGQLVQGSAYDLIHANESKNYSLSGSCKVVLLLSVRSGAATVTLLYRSIYSGLHSGVQLSSLGSPTHL